jgi:hypothetical protein
MHCSIGRPQADYHFPDKNFPILACFHDSN